MPRTTRRPAADHAALSSRIKEAIGASGLTCYALGKRAGVAPEMISRFLSGERGLSLATADRLAGALGLRLIQASRPRGKARADRVDDPPVGRDDA